MFSSKKTTGLVLIIVSVFLYSVSSAQDLTKNKFGKGLTFVAEDSSYSFKFGARFQTLYQGVLNLENEEYSDRFLTRRARLKLDGFAFTPKLVYKFELGLSNLDISGGDIQQLGNASSMILDAVLKYNFCQNWTIWFGQTKLPGNIERVISSQQLQFVDRSTLNSRFNIDRDKGIQVRYDGNKFRSISAISSGEGRNVTVDNEGGYDYTQRFEWLPFGQFSGGGDYSGSDLKREQKPKLLLGVTYDYNDRASRQRGQLGTFLSEERSLRTWFADAHFKYNGISSMISYANKVAPKGSVILEPNGNFKEAFYTGTAFSWQAGYLLKNNLEFAARFTNVTPEKITQRNADDQYTLGMSKYFVGHNLKIQSDVTYINEMNGDNQIMYRFQVEFAL
ncbi:MAG: FmdC precursor [Cyclobacteriaceae bacterium]|nr:FmdC precursor [Cyclobacteriaceae bacterium]